MHKLYSQIRNFNLFTFSSETNYFDLNDFIYNFGGGWGYSAPQYPKLITNYKGNYGSGDGSMYEYGNGWGDSQVLKEYLKIQTIFCFENA